LGVQTLIGAKDFCAAAPTAVVALAAEYDGQKEEHLPQAPHNEEPHIPEEGDDHLHKRREEYACDGTENDPVDVNRHKAEEHDHQIEYDDECARRLRLLLQLRLGLLDGLSFGGVGDRLDLGGWPVTPCEVKRTCEGVGPKGRHQCGKEKIERDDVSTHMIHRSSTSEERDEDRKQGAEQDKDDKVICDCAC